MTGQPAANSLSARISRKDFGIGVLAMGLGAGLASASAQTSAGGAEGTSNNPPTTPSASGQTHYFFKNSAFEFVLLATLGRAYHQAGNVGKVLWVIKQIEDGNYQSAHTALVAAGDEARDMAADAASRGRVESARQAYLWATNYYDSAGYFADGTGDPNLAAKTWQMMDDCWLASISLFRPPIVEVAIPYEGTTLRGFYFRGTGTGAKRPLLILVNGSDGTALDMWTMGAAGGTVRGYDCLTFDGPGQGYALWKQGLHFRPDFEKVVTPVLDFALGLEGIDPGRIALQGISQGGYWVPRAAAFEKRIAAVVADPGVTDVGSSWTATLPPPMLALLKAGRKDEFDGYMAEALKADPEAKYGLVFRMRPYGVTSYYEAFKAAMGYTLAGVAGEIQCPVLITEPANEAFWPGQSRQLYDMLRSPKTLVTFTVPDGADLHCEPKGYGLRDMRILDWLDETLR